MGAQMKGLQQFIADLRAVNTKEEQDQRIQSEIVNIQKQFNNSDKLNGYQRKKYISKLIYIYLTASCNINTFNISFGSKQILELLSSKVYSEKFIGYLAVMLLGNVTNSKDDGTDFINLIINSLKNDLKSSDLESNLLALQCISNLGNEIYADLLIEDVFQVLRSPTATPLLKKRSALALLKLVRANKEVLLRHKPWIPRILALADDSDLGVVLSVLPLIEFIALEIDFEQTKHLIPTLTKKLNLLILESDKLPKDYFFGKIANPWLIVKITKIITILVPDSHELQIDLNSLRVLRECVAKVIECTTKSTVDPAIRNAHNAVLFSMIALAGHLDPSPDALSSSIDAITKLLDSNDLNTRYLALNSLISLSSKTKYLKNSQKHLLKIFHLLREPDVSITKKSLDLIYVLADYDSINLIVSELLKILRSSDHVIKQEIAIKVSILCEKYAKDPSWFVSTILELIDISGNSLNESIWERIVQIITNNENSQEFACKEVIKYLTKPKFVEPMVKIGSYILGEFGFLIKDEISLAKQFDILTNVYFFVSNNTRSMLLFSFLNLLRNDIDNKLLRSNLIKILRMEVNSINSELQQRSYEYLTLISRLNTNEGKMMFEIIFDELPVFNTKENPLLLRLSKTNPAAKQELIRSTEDLTLKLKHTTMAQPSTPTIKEEFDDSDLIDPFSDDIQVEEEPLSPNWQQGFYRIFEFNQGVFFENSLIKIILRIQKRDNAPKDSLNLSLNFVNKSPQPLSSFITNFVNYKTVKPNLILNQISLPDTDIPVEQRTSSSLEVLLRGPFTFDEIPNLKIQFNSGGGFNVIRLKLPIFLTKFVAPTLLPFAQFLQHWKQIDTLGDSGESVKLISGVPTDNDWLRRFVDKLGFSIVEQRSDQFIFGSGILHTSSKGNFGVLLKVKIVSPDSIEIRIRVTSPEIGELIGDSIAKFFSH